MKTLNTILTACAFTLLLSSHAAQAATDTWQGGTNTWALGFSPTWASGDSALFDGVGNQTVVVNLGAAQTAAGISVSSNQTGTMLFEGGGAAETLFLGSGGINLASGAGALTIGAVAGNQNVITSLTANQSWENDSSSLFTVSNGITNGATATPLTLTITGSGSGGDLIGGVISDGTGGSTTALTINTSSSTTTTLSGNNTFTGGFTLLSGTVKVTNLAGLGSINTAINLDGGTLNLATNTTNTTPPAPITSYKTIIGGDVTINSTGITSGASTGNGIPYLLGTLSIGADTLTATTTGVTSTTVPGRVQFGSTTLTGNATLNATEGALIVIGAGGTSNGLAGNFNLLIESTDGTGGTSLRGGNGGTRSSGVTTFQSGNNTINGGTPDILGTVATSLVLNGGSLDITDSGSGIEHYATTIGGNFTLTNASNNVTQTLGALTMGSFTLTTGTLAATGTENLAFGATTFNGGTSTFNVNNGLAGGTSTSVLTLGALNDGGTAVTIIKTGASTLNLGGATTSLTADDQIDISAGTLSSNNATALGTAAGSGVTVDVADGAIFKVGASQTIGALTNTTGIHTANSGSVALGAFNLTIGSTANLGGTFGGVISGTGGIIKAGTGTEILTGANTYSGATTINGGILSTNLLALGGTASGIGQSTNVAASLVLNGGILQYTGGTVTTDRAFTLGANGGGFDASGTGALTITGAMTDSQTTGTQTFTLTGTNTAANTLSGKITNGTGTALTAVTKTGNGTWVLSGANTYTGGTNINGGELSLGSTGAIGTAGTISFGGGTLQFSAANITDYSSRFSTAAGQAYSIDTNGQDVTFATSLTSVGGTFTLDDTNATTGILTFTALNSYSGLTSVDNGELNLDKSNGVTVAGALTVGDSIGAADTAIVKLLAANQIGTGSAVTVNSDGRLDLNDFTDQVTSLLSNGGDITSSTSGGHLTVTGTTTFDGTGNTIDAGTIVTTSGLATMGSGATLAVNGTLGGALTVGNGTLSGAGTVTGNTTVNGGTIDLGSGGSIGGTLGVTGGDWSGLGSVTGLVTSSSGDFNIDSNADLTASAGVDVTGGTISSTDNTGTITSSVNYTSSSSSTYSGVIAGNTSTVTLNNAAASLDFTGANTYGGGTVIEAGHFEVNNTSGSGTGSGSVDVQSGASLGGGNETGSTTSVGGATLGVYAANVKGIISGGVTIESGAHLAPGNSVGTLSVGSLTLSSGSIADYEFNATANDFTAVTGQLTLNGGGFNLYQEGTTNAFAEVGTYNLMSYGSLAGSLTNLSVLNEQAGFTYTFFDDTADNILQLDITGESVVPEPSTWALMFGGLALLMVIQHRKRRQS